MNGKRRVNPDDTKVKYAKSERISLVTGNQVRQFYHDEDRGSDKVERSRLFQQNPSPPHHTRYLPEPRAYQAKARKRSSFCGLKSKTKRLISYCLIYVLMFACAMTLLYLFYTPQKMNLFGFYSNSNLRLKFYRFVLGRNASTTITPKIITTTEPTIFITHSTTSSSSHAPTVKTKPFLPKTDTKASSSTHKPVVVEPTTEATSEFDSPVSSSTSSPVEESDDHKTDMKKDQVHDLENSKSITTCITINVTEPTQASVDKSRSTSTTKVVTSTASSAKPPASSTAKPAVKPATKSSKLDSKRSTTSTTSTTTEPPTTLAPKDNSTETIEFKEKISYSAPPAGMEKNETIDEEALVDNGVLPTEEEEEEKRKDELESKQKIAAFFGVDPVTGKEKDDKLNPLVSERQSPRGKAYNLESDQMQTRSVSNVEPKQSNKWFPNQSNQPFARGDLDYPANHNKPKEDEFAYHPMLRLLYRNCGNYRNSGTCS